METKTLEAAVKPSPIDDAKMFKDAKEMEKSTGTLLHIHYQEKHIFLRFETELPDALKTFNTESNINVMEVRLGPVLKKMDEFDKIKIRLNHEVDAFVINGIFDDNVRDELCNLSIISHEDQSIRAHCFTQQVSDGKEKPIKSFYQLMMERMK
ncbi:uncharacterized protein LOC110444968 [Mizuhopecten yessoensis]|uniref:Uncharacterized protein n=1 Tax=Mizuhopecten yessoensis TaxID=6573 RepID=A0A210PDI4_MIZYE|nr:uncharacterized protein LOC110444968 [Mizuhopecten yessoensis]OWF34527.1 hypothetical protein KP79_PYT03360 [Mizuhopecten yessoensis]